MLVKRDSIGTPLVRFADKQKTEMTKPNDLVLSNVIKNSYTKKHTKEFEGGFRLDKGLSNHNQQVYYNPQDKKLLYSVAGTHNISDIGTDIMLATGRIKNTKRYKEADDTLKLAKQKYGVNNATIVGHSLGGSIGGLIGSGDDKIISLNKGAVGQKVRKNETNYRTKGDLVSLFSANDKNTQNLINDNPREGFIRDALNAHSSNISKNIALL